MSVVFRAYLFDVDDFRRAITPVMEGLQKDNFNLLRLQANEIGENNPDVWKVLEDFRYCAGDFEQEEIQFDEIEDRVRFWMFIIMANFWQKVDLSRTVNVRAIAESLTSLRANDEIIALLTRGRGICSLLYPELLTKSISEQDNGNWPSWCCRYGLVGWLDITDARELLSALLQLQSTRTDIAEIQEAIYQELEQLLSTAVRLNKGLFLAILD